MSQEELGFASGIHRTYIGVIERGEKVITVQKLATLARALNCRPSAILAACNL
jgi:transcriptional regulator with XRE-family HTH domain